MKDKYKYFMSFKTEKGFGNSCFNADQEIKNFEHINDIAEQSKKEFNVEEFIILFYREM